MSQRPLSTLSIAPSTLSALTRAGYHDINDLSTSSPEVLSTQLSISLPASKAVFAAASSSLSVPSPSTSSFPPLTQSAASLTTSISAQRFPTHCPPIDKLLNGGLARGYILEVSGPPGTLKESAAIGVVLSFVQRSEGILFVDAQNMTGPSALIKALNKLPSLPPNYKSLIYHMKIHTLPAFMTLIHTLSVYLEAHPETRLLVLSSISFPFQTPNLTPSNKTALLERVKHALVRACAMHSLTVVITSQLATKLINADGSAGNFDTGSKAVMVPQLGPAYLPSGRAYRVIIHPNARMSGHVRMLSSPTTPSGRASAQREEYVIAEGRMV